MYIQEKGGKEVGGGWGLYKCKVGFALKLVAYVGVEIVVWIGNY